MSETPEHPGDGAVRSESRWAIVRGFARVGRRFLEGWRALGPAGRRRWWIGAAITAVAAVALMLVMLEIARGMVDAESLAWETGWLERLRGEDAPFSFSTAVWIQTFGTDITLWILLIGGGSLFAWQRRPIVTLNLVTGYILVDLIVRMSWMLWDRQRPAHVLGQDTAPAFASFPSGHTGKTIAVYGILVLAWFTASRSWIERTLALLLLAGLAVVVAFGRLRMGAHWPSDVVAGGILGIVVAGMLTGAAVRARPGTPAGQSAPTDDGPAASPPA